MDRSILRNLPWGEEIFVPLLFSVDERSHCIFSSNRNVAIKSYTVIRCDLIFFLEAISFRLKINLLSDKYGHHHYFE